MSMRILLPLAAAGLASAVLLANPARARATVGMQEKAKALGYPSDDCTYCHTFSRDHMTKHAREAGLQTTNCLTCHGETLPLEKYELYNERGRYLRDVKKARQAREADMRWLKDYVEPAKKHPSPRPRSPGGND
jgi:hypothetical protein